MDNEQAARITTTRQTKRRYKDRRQHNTKQSALHQRILTAMIFLKHICSALTSYLLVDTVRCASVAVSESTDVAKQIPSSPSDGKPVILTTWNFDKHIGDGNIWLVEFYSPFCIHCTQFAPTFDEIARAYHNSDQRPTIKVGKVDGNIEKALASRFNINAYPSFFVIDGYKVYSFDQLRSKQNMMQFADGGFKKTDPIPFYSSPMGPIGILQGLLITLGVNAADLFAWSQTRFGVSPLFAGSILFGSVFLGIFVVIVFLAILIPPKLKEH